MYSQSSTYKRRTPAKVPDTLGMLPDRNSLKPEEFEDLDDDNPNRHPNGSKFEITMKIKRRIPDAHDSVYVTLTFEEEDEDPGDPKANLDDSFTDSAADSEDLDEFTKLGNVGKS